MYDLTTDVYKEMQLSVPGKQKNRKEKNRKERKKEKKEKNAGRAKLEFRW
jgi:hypothetical protein